MHFAKVHHIHLESSSFEHQDDFTNISSEEIIKEKENMLLIVKDTGLDVSDDYDIKKAYELILKNN